MSQLANQIAVVTGAGRGIGRAIALKFANEGADVVCVSRTQENSEKVAAEIRALGLEVAPSVGNFVLVLFPPTGPRSAVVSPQRPAPPTRAPAAAPPPRTCTSAAPSAAARSGARSPVYFLRLTRAGA